MGQLVRITSRPAITCAASWQQTSLQLCAEAPTEQAKGRRAQATGFELSSCSGWQAQ